MIICFKTVALLTSMWFEGEPMNVYHIGVLLHCHVSRCKDFGPVVYRWFSDKLLIQ